MISSLKKLLLVPTFCMALSGIYAQDTPRELASLVNMKAAYLDDSMAEKGYKHVKTEKSDTDSYTYWWNNSNKKCVIARTTNGKVASLVSSSSTDCNKSGNNGSNQSFKMYDLQGMKADTAYESLKQNGFGEVKEVKGDGVTYKLWWNSNKKECIKTTSKNYYIFKVETANNCTNSGSGNSSNDKKGFNMYDLQGMKAVTAYESLKQNGYGEVKENKGDDVTFKLWWNSRREDCIKTTSKNYYILKVEKSNNCK